ncbi:unnamed protein product [Cuscuta europaea]|uniref:Uncharacterized protein n=1 Tax=Cuscuta europaea TaxID=41803 RepID=A0A9P0ZGM9_CUSEU|nr:unnamed protein product [Cuscuta europaea]
MMAATEGGRHTIVLFFDIDVIGKEVGRCAPQSHVINNRTERLMEHTLEDSENRIGCTLWNNYIKQFNDYVDNAENEAIFIIVQLCQAKLYKGNVSVSTHLT